MNEQQHERIKQRAQVYAKSMFFANNNPFYIVHDNSEKKDNQVHGLKFFLEYLTPNSFPAQYDFYFTKYSVEHLIELIENSSQKDEIISNNIDLK